MSAGKRCRIELWQRREGRINRKRTVQDDQRRYRNWWRIEAAFCRLKDFHRIATRYDKLAANFLSAVALAAIIAFWV